MTFHLSKCLFPHFTRVYSEENWFTQRKTLKTTISPNKGMAIYDLELLKAEGWRVHIKNVKDKDYIVAQRTPPGQTKRVSKGLGRFNLNLWLQLEALGMTPQNVQNKPLYQDDNAAIMSMQKQIDAIKTHNADKWKELRKYVNKRLRNLAKQLKTKPVYLQDIIWLEDGSETTMLDKFVDYIVDDVIELEGLNKKINLVEKKIDEFSIMDLAGSVVCPQCDEEGLVSIQIRCNACGVQMGMGWYPSAS